MSHEHRYTHGHAESVLRSHRWRTAENSVAYLLPHLSPGLTLLDVGSGPGTITADLAERVAPGRVTALEVSEETAALTRDELDRRDVAHATVRVGDVHALPFPDDTFDVVHAHQVLHHVADPVQALREMARVARPGGLVAVCAIAIALPASRVPFFFGLTISLFSVSVDREESYWALPT